MDSGSKDGEAAVPFLNLPPRASWENDVPLLNIPGTRSNIEGSPATPSSSRPPELQVNVPHTGHTFDEIITASGTYKDGDLAINLAGLRMGTTAHPRVEQGPMTLADLQSLKVLGKGSSAVVQLVMHRGTGQIFALKEIQMSVEEPVRSSIKKELRINQERREHVVECYQTFYCDGRISIVLEYMDGGSLADVLKHQGKIGERQLAAVSKQALLGLLSLHRDHIIHRDIKPSNMLLNKRGEVKITDFGVSTLLTSTLDVGQTFVGTYTYMSPERISGDAYSYNSDTWALGLSILECAVGHFPYFPPRKGQWGNFYELLNTVVQKPAPVAPEGEFSPEFCSFINDCLQKEPVARSTVSQLLVHPFLRKYKDQSIDIGELCSPGR